MNSGLLLFKHKAGRGSPVNLWIGTGTFSMRRALLGLMLVSSLARPGGNITGLTALNNELAGKRVQLLMEIVPGIAKIAVLRNFGNASNRT